MIHLTYDKNKKDPIYYAQLATRVGKKVTSKTVERIGKHSELLNITEDPLAYARTRVKELDESFKKDRDVQLQIKVDFSEKVPAASGLKASKSTMKNVGYFYIQKIIGKLRLRAYCAELEESTKAQYPIYDILRFLIISRIMRPESKLATSQHIDQYYESPNFQYHQILRFLSLLAGQYTKFIEYLFKMSNHIVKRNTDVCYYDCTNYYFEIESPDEEYVDEVTGEVIKAYRRYGFSKEHRPNPVIGMGLFMDCDGIPITMALYPGNQNEQVSTLPLERQMIKMLDEDKRDIIYCSDAGLGSYGTRVYNSLSCRHFVVTQSIKTLSQLLQDAVFDSADYQLLSNGEKTSIAFMKTFDRNDINYLDLYQDRIFKVIPADQPVDLPGFFNTKHFKNGNTQQVKAKALLKQWILVTFSRKMFEYQRFIRNRQIERAKELLAQSKDPEEIKKSPHDIKRFLRKKNRSATEYEIDTERIAEEEKYDGFYAIATNLPLKTKTGELDKTEIARVLSIQEGRYKIEECFRMLKTNFEARPVYLSLNDHIIAHFMICYAALLVYRLIEKNLDDRGTHCTVDNIRETLKNMNVSNNKDLYETAGYTASEALNALEGYMQLGLTRLNYKPNELRKLSKKIL